MSDEQDWMPKAELIFLRHMIQEVLREAIGYNVTEEVRLLIRDRVNACAKAWAAKGLRIAEGLVFEVRMDGGNVSLAPVSPESERYFVLEREVGRSVRRSLGHNFPW